MNIGIGKMGKSMLFASHKWGLVGGDAAPSILYTALAAMNPDITFYIVGRSDFEKLSEVERQELFPNNNVIDCWKDLYGTPFTQIPDDTNLAGPLDFCSERGIQLDAFILMSGMCSSVNMDNKIWAVKDPTKHSKTLYQFKRYAGPIIHFLNETNVPMFTISEDPRHIQLKAKDLFNRERFCLSQENTTVPIKHIVSYENQQTVPYDIPVVYGQTEKIFLIGEEKKNTLEYTKDIPITMFMNSHTMTAKATRKPFIDQYIHSNFPETKVYGKWPQELMDTDNRYEAIRMGDIMDEVLRTKYTLVVSIKPGFVTCKPWEMINFGIIPFLHPSYDPNNLLGLPKILHTKSPEDFKKRIEYLEANPEKYKYLREKLQDMLKPEYYNGTYMNNLVMQKVYDITNKGDYEPKTSGNVIKLSSFIKQRDIPKLKPTTKLF